MRLPLPGVAADCAGNRIRAAPVHRPNAAALVRELDRTTRVRGSGCAGQHCYLSAALPESSSPPGRPATDPASCPRCRRATNHGFRTATPGRHRSQAHRPTRSAPPTSANCCIRDSIAKTPVGSWISAISCAISRRPRRFRCVAVPRIQVSKSRPPSHAVSPPVARSEWLSRARAPAVAAGESARPRRPSVARLPPRLQTPWGPYLPAVPGPRRTGCRGTGSLSTSRRCA